MFIDDEPDSLEPLKRFLGRRDLDIEEETHNFPEARNRVAGYRPNIVILDLADAANPEHPEAEAQGTLGLVWKEHFCPIICRRSLPP